MYVINRREALAAGAAIAATALVPGLAQAQATNNSAQVIAAFTGGKPPGTGKIKMDLPEIAENGASVPLTFSVDSPMTEASHVTEVLIVSEGNPNPAIATLVFTPLSGKAEAAVRIRLAATQNVALVAKMNDGATFIEKKQVKVTIGGC
jgi:sulfur-oxidizing protein SoxY